MKICRSRMGWEIWGPVVLLPGYLAAIFIRSSAWLPILFLISLSLFFGMLAANTRYYIVENTLRIRCWFIIDQRIDIQSIHPIRNTLNPIASPAASLIGRIEVFYDTGKSVIISPRDKSSFMGDLRSRNKSILTFEAK